MPVERSEGVAPMLPGMEDYIKDEDLLFYVPVDEPDKKILLEEEGYQLSMQAFIESLYGSPAIDFGYKYFFSRSKGRSKGRGRQPSPEPIPRRRWREFELVEVADNHWVTYKDGGGKLDGFLPEKLTEEGLIELLRHTHDSFVKYRLKITKKGLVTAKKPPSP